MFKTIILGSLLVLGASSFARGDGGWREAFNNQRYAKRAPITLPEEKVGCYTDYDTQAEAQANCPAYGIPQRINELFGNSGWTCNCSQTDRSQH